MTAAGAYDAVLFDFGHTLFAHPGGVAVLQAAADELGHPLDHPSAGELWAEIDRAAMDPAEVARGRDLDSEVWRSRWKVLYGLADRVLPGLGDALDASFHDPWAWVPYADTAAVLADLADSGIGVGVLSNTGWDIRTPFRVRGLERFIGSFTLSYEAGAVKPDPGIFHTACRSLGADPARTLMVGDDPIADTGAVAAGLADVLLVDPATPLGEPHGLDRVIRAVSGRA